MLGKGLDWYTEFHMHDSPERETAIIIILLGSLAVSRTGESCI